MILASGEVGEASELHVRARERFTLMRLDAHAPSRGHGDRKDDQPAHHGYGIRPRP